MSRSVASSAAGQGRGPSGSPRLRQHDPWEHKSKADRTQECISEEALEVSSSKARISKSSSAKTGNATYPPSSPVRREGLQQKVVKWLRKGDLEELKSERTKADLRALVRATAKAENEKRKRRDADRIARWDEFGISHIVMEIERRGDQAEPITFSTRSLWMKEPIRSHVSHIIFKYVDDAPRVATGEFRVKIKEMFKSNYIKGTRYVSYLKSEISTSDLSPRSLRVHFLIRRRNNSSRPIVELCDRSYRFKAISRRHQRFCGI